MKKLLWEEHDAILNKYGDFEPINETDATRLRTIFALLNTLPSA